MNDDGGAKASQCNKWKDAYSFSSSSKRTLHFSILIFFSLCIHVRSSICNFAFFERKMGGIGGIFYLGEKSAVIASLHSTNYTYTVQGSIPQRKKGEINH